MLRASMLAARPLGAALAMAVLCVVRPAAADPSPLRVAVGETGAVAGEPALARALSTALAEALEHQSDVRLTGRRRAQLVLRGSVVSLERHRLHQGLEVHCEVSLIVADARGGSIRAMLRGRAGARGGADAARLSGDALRAAVRSALRPLTTQGRALARAGR